MTLCVNKLYFSWNFRLREFLYSLRHLLVLSGTLAYCFGVICIRLLFSPWTCGHCPQEIWNSHRKWWFKAIQCVIYTKYGKLAMLFLLQMRNPTNFEMLWNAVAQVHTSDFQFGRMFLCFLYFVLSFYALSTIIPDVCSSNQVAKWRGETHEVQEGEVVNKES